MGIPAWICLEDQEVTEVLRVRKLETGDSKDEGSQTELGHAALWILLDLRALPKYSPH